MSGRAVTVKTRPGDNLVVHKALDVAEPGDIVIVDAGGDLTNALIGELMVAHAVARKLGGIVIHGAIRDSHKLCRGSFPVFALGVTHRGPYKDGPGEVNTPIAINGMVIHPGDLILGDADGLISIPVDHIQTVLAAARRKLNDEAVILAETRAQTYDRSWIDELLKGRGCTFE
jgi:regulator of RNase E activity RraA